MTSNNHFETAASWKDARPLISFDPRIPRYTASRDLQSLRIHVRDHKLREIENHRRTLEAHYGAFVVSQAHPGKEEARRLALDVAYGREKREGRIAGREARIFELGPQPPPDDIDGRSPAVITWHDEGAFYLIASVELSAAELKPIAASMYEN